MRALLSLTITILFLADFGLQAQEIDAAANQVDLDEKSDEKVQVSDFKEGNVWTTEDSVKYFTCPVMKGENRVEYAAAYSEINNVRYYHCCPACQAPFRANPGKWLNDLVTPGNVVAVDEAGRKHFRDPVNSEYGIVGEKTISVDHQSKRYYFVAESSKAAFLATPQLYLNDAE